MTMDRSTEGRPATVAAQSASPAGRAYVAGWMIAGAAALVYVAAFAAPRLSETSLTATGAMDADVAAARSAAPTPAAVNEEADSTAGASIAEKPVIDDAHAASDAQSMRAQIARLEQALQNRGGAAAATPSLSHGASDGTAGAASAAPLGAALSQTPEEAKSQRGLPPLPVRAPRLTTASTRPLDVAVAPPVIAATQPAPPAEVRPDAVTLPTRVLNAALDAANGAPGQPPVQPEQSIASIAPQPLVVPPPAATPPSSPAIASAPPTARPERPAIVFGAPVVRPAARPSTPPTSTATAAVDGGVASTSAVSTTPSTPSIGIEIAIGGSVVQLREAWQSALDRNYQALATLEPRVRPAGQGETSPLALLAGPLSSLSDAQQLCARLRSAGQTCEISDFAGRKL